MHGFAARRVLRDHQGRKAFRAFLGPAESQAAQILPADGGPVAALGNNLESNGTSFAEQTLVMRD
jgi:hypothetical protein